MAQTPDRKPGEADEEGSIYRDRGPGNGPPTAGGLRYVDGRFSMRDALGLFDPRPSVFAHEPLLNGEPNDQDHVYTYAKSGGKVVLEEWERVVGSTLAKSIDYTYSGNKLDTAVVKVFAANGTTVLAQTTTTYTWSGSELASSTTTRDV